MKLHSSELRDYIASSLSYDAYLALVDGLLADGLTTGPKQNAAMTAYTKLNRHRMARLAKTVELDESVEKAIAGKKLSQIWLVLTEGWCGDAAQNLPVIEKIAAANPGIETRYLLRDEHPELIDLFQTKGKRSIPKIVVVDTRTFRSVGSWGPRPAAAQRVVNNLMKLGAEKNEIMETLQRWYNDDHGHSLQREFVELIDQWAERRRRRAPLAATV